MNKKTLLAAGFALACTLSAPVFASDTIVFDPDGLDATNGDTLVGSFDWAVASALADGAIPTATNSDFELYAHAALQGFLDTNGDPSGAPTGLNVDTTGFEITFVTGFTETITNVTTGAVTDTGSDSLDGDNILEFKQTITLADAGTQTVNFYEIYYDDLSDGSGLKSNSLTGAGYNDGDLILSAELVSLSGNFTATFTFEDNNNDGVFNAGDTLITGLLDQFGTDNWAGQQTISGEGATQLVADVMYQDPNFFKTDITTLVENLFFNTSNVVPFDETNPSNSFDDGSGGVISTGNGLLNVGAVNGVSGPDIIFQADSNTSFNSVEVPEPNTVLLFALGLLFLGYGSRNHYLRRS